jgi:hypothetical protein
MPECVIWKIIKHAEEREEKGKGASIFVVCKCLQGIEML